MHFIKLKMWLLSTVLSNMWMCGESKQDCPTAAKLHYGTNSQLLVPTKTQPLSAFFGDIFAAFFPTVITLEDAFTRPSLSFRCVKSAPMLSCLRLAVLLVSASWTSAHVNLFLNHTDHIARNVRNHCLLYSLTNVQFELSALSCSCCWWVWY